MADDAAPTGEGTDVGDESAKPGEPEPTAIDLTATAESEDSDFADSDLADSDAESDVPAVESKPGGSHVRLALIAGLVAVVALAALTGWLGFRANQSRESDAQRQLFLQVGRQGALNLTTLNFETIDSDVQRLLDSATGTFYDDFQNRAPSFIEVVKQVKSKSVGTVTEAGLESETPTEAQVLVAVTVKSELVGQPEQAPRSWRMRILVQKVADETKVSNVEFVP